MKRKRIIKPQSIESIVVTNYMPYAVSTIQDRAIVGIDGMKPVHRRILHSMMQDGLLRGSKVKSAKAVGNVLKYHPHGDGAVYETMVRLSQDDAMNIPLIEGKGNLGEYTSSELQPAHMRYTEVKLSPIVKELFADINKLQSLMIPNFDESALEPMLLPTKFPHILANVSMGIATGMRSRICGFNLKELCEATIAIMDKSEVNLLDILKAPDFPTGGEILYNEKKIKEIYETGKGSLKIRASIVNKPDENVLTIKEIPYTTTREAIIETIISLIKDKTLNEIIDVNDLTGLNGMEIELEYKKNTDVELLINKLYKLTTLEDTYSCDFNLLIDGKPKVLGVKAILEEWVKFRVQCIREIAQVDIDNTLQELNILNGYKAICTSVDTVIDILRMSDTEEAMKEKLKNELHINETQAEHIINMKMKNINYKFLAKKIEEIESLETFVENSKLLLRDESKVYDVIKNDLNDIVNKYNTPRRSKINNNTSIISKEDLIPSYPVKILITEQKYIKKIKSTAFRANGALALKDGDKIVKTIDADNKGYILMFSSKGNVIRKRINDIEEVKMSQLGTYLPNIVELEKDENILDVVSTLDFSGDLFISFENGKIARIPLSAYNTSRNKLLNAYSSYSPIISMFILEDEADILLASSIDKILIINSSEIPAKNTKTTLGVACMKEKNESVVKLCSLANNFKGITDMEYYKSRRNSIGKYIRKTDSLTNQ